MAEYDPENIFAKIIDGKIPCFKVFESKASLAFLDAFPMVEGHTLLVPKLKGYVAFTDMPAGKASEFLRDLQVVAKAVQEATGATGINIWQNNGADSGQAVPHPHFHIVPRFKDDKLHDYPPSAKDMLAPDRAEPVVKKITDILNPPKALKKAKFGKVSSIKPDSKGLNLALKVLEAPQAVEAKVGKFFEVLAGDATGTVVVSLRDDQKDVVAEGKVINLRNAAVRMVQSHIRLTVDKWGKIEASDETVEDVDKSDEKNLSKTEYELVTGK